MSPLWAESRAAFLEACPVSRETVCRFERYEAMLVKRNQTLSLIADSTIDVLWTRHFLDCAQLHALISQPGRPVIDLGAGAGFPGLVLAIMGLSDVHLVENNMQKVTFLRDVAAELDLPVTIHAMKAESVRPFPVGVVTSRALAPLDHLIGLSRKFLGAGSVCVFPKGRKAAHELEAAERHWRMKIERFPSRTDPESTIFRLSDIVGAQG
jgi:16S rRNA (guanine527-N7)-methyltransferase